MKKLLAIFAISLGLVVSAQAQKLTGDPVKDIRNAVSKRPVLTGDPLADIKNATGSSTETPSCTFTAFAKLTPNNIVPFIQACAEVMQADSQAALNSATTAKDTTAQGCLTPGTALITAAIGTPGVPAVPAVPATATTPEIPAVAAVPAKLAGPILIFQKFREFVMSAGLSNCNAWVNTTIASTIGSAAAIPIPIP